MDTEDRIPLAAKVAFLASLPSVRQVIETHAAYVFLTNTRAFKLKKPVLLGYSDCRTLAGRERACAKELYLNRDLAPGVYLGRVPLCLSRDGLTLSGSGEIVDWLVKMERLPSKRMLDGMLKADRRPTAADLSGLSALLADFYRRQAQRPLPRHIYFSHLLREQMANVANLSELAAHLPDPRTLSIVAQTTQALVQARTEISDRERKGLIVDGHGDLRPEHICLTDPPVIFDRIESSLELRIIDPWDEIGYLGAEASLMGYDGLAEHLGQALCHAGFPSPSTQLGCAYGMFRMVTRARLSLDHLRDAPPSDRRNWVTRANLYLDAAERIRQSAHASTGA